MTAPSTFVATGTFTEADGTTPIVGTITIRATDTRFVNNGNVINASKKVVTLDGSGTIGSVTLIQATNGYDYTTDFVGHASRKVHFAGTANLSITPSAPSTMTVTGAFFTEDNAVAAGTIELLRVSTGTVHVKTLDGSGTMGSGLIVPQDAAGYVVTEKLVGRWVSPSYPIAAAGSTLNLASV